MKSSEMPPEGPLPPNIVEDFVKWVNAGAVDPRKSEPKDLPSASEIDLDEGRKYWAFRPLEDFRAGQRTRVPNDCGTGRSAN